MAGPSSAGPLSGLGILVTRPARQAAGFARKIATLGGAPVIFPAIVILPPRDTRAVESARAALATYDVAIFVSPNAVEYGIPDPRGWPQRLAVFAPGPGTAEALVAAGIADVRIPATTFDSEGMLALPELAEMHGKRVLILRGEGGREHLADSLRARGAQVDAVACYRREQPRSGVEGLAEAFGAGAIDVVTITSSEALDNLWSLANASIRAAWRARPTFAPHPRIVARAREFDLSVIETAGGDAGLIAGLLEWAAAHPSPKS
ncbi:MAG TPA: uroporphyrinogen-III synthase [Casimicrobiaceae bacterium]|nr:uroporphyrinogen-III synthase [Casimicrobiaceae bacterium]